MRINQHQAGPPTISVIGQRGSPATWLCTILLGLSSKDFNETPVVSQELPKASGRCATCQACDIRPSPESNEEGPAERGDKRLSTLGQSMEVLAEKNLRL